MKYSLYRILYFVKGHLLFVFPIIFLILPFNTDGQRKSKLISAFNESDFDAVEWRLVGPFRGGRAGTVCGVKDKTNLYYMGTAGGGVWKTQDGGNTWSCISDGFFGGSIGAVTVAESDPNVIYVGEGEQTLRGNVSSGKGLWRSTDAGKTWKNIGLTESEHIGRIKVHPKNSDWVYVAAIGNLWKPNTMRGVFRSKDGGDTWEKILYENDKAGAVDIVLDPNNPRIIFASTWEMKRNGYRMDSGGPGSKLWKSTDGGDTWVDITKSKGLPKGTLGIIGVTISPVNSERIWTIIEAENGGVFRSDDGGVTWKKTSSKRDLRQRAWYYSRIYADTQNEDRVYVLNVGLWVSNDGGNNFDRKRTPHGDHHDLWINPENNEIVAVADDGGGQVSYDQGDNWTTYYNQPTAQFYRVTTDDHFPFRIYGAQQDNSSIRIAHRSANRSITERDWEPSAGGESAHLAPYPSDPDIVFGGTYKGYMMRKDHKTGQIRSTNVWPDNPAGSGAEVMKYRFNWNYPIMFSPHNPDRLYAGSNYLHLSTNQGQSWEVISPDLTRNDPKTIRSSGGAITQDNTGAEFYANIFAMAESPIEEGVIWTGSDDGLIHVTRDGGENWENVTPPNSPKQNMMNCIDINPHEKGSVYVAATTYKFGDYTPYLYKTSDYGKTWKMITKGIPSKYYTRVIRADKTKAGLLYAGTEWGMFVSFDDGAQWVPMQLNLPVTAIRDLALKDNTLIAATHGRSFWMIDDLTPFQEMSIDIAKRNAYLFKSKPAYRMAQNGRSITNKKLAGANHPDGVLFHYNIKELKEDDKVELVIMEQNGAVINSYKRDAQNGLKVEPGGNRFVWDMRYKGFETFEGMILYSSPNKGPKAVPGIYRAKLKYNGEEIEQEFEIKADPRLNNTLEDYKAQFNYLIQVRDKVSMAHQGIKDIRTLKKDIQYVKEKLKGEQNIGKINQLMTTLKKDIEVIENKIHMTKNESYQDPLNYGIRINNRIAFLMADQQRGDYPPTDQAITFFEEVSSELDSELEKLNGLIANQLPAINNKIRAYGLKLVSNRKTGVNP